MNNTKSFVTTVVSFLAMSLSLNLSQAFTIPSSQSKTFTRLHSSSLSPEELINSPDIWNPLKESLNTVPVFACTNTEGQPLQYQVGDMPLAFFYLDVNAAKVELKKAEDETKMEGLNLTPFPLGEVFEMGVKKLGIVIPGQDAIEAAGAPAGMSPVGQQVPLFGCMDMVENLPDGSTMVPMFLDKGEAESAMNMALEGLDDEAEKAKFKVDVMPLAGAVQMQVQEAGKRSFTYVPDSAALDYLRALEQ